MGMGTGNYYIGVWGFRGCQDWGPNNMAEANRKMLFRGE